MAGGNPLGCLISLDRCPPERLEVGERLKVDPARPRVGRGPAHSSPTQSPKCLSDKLTPDDAWCLRCWPFRLPPHPGSSQPGGNLSRLADRRPLLGPSPSPRPGSRYALARASDSGGRGDPDLLAVDHDPPGVRAVRDAVGVAVSRGTSESCASHRPWTSVWVHFLDHHFLLWVHSGVQNGRTSGQNLCARWLRERWRRHGSKASPRAVLGRIKKPAADPAGFSGGGGIEPPSRNGPNGGLYMLSPVFCLTPGDDHEQPAPGSSRLLSRRRTDGGVRRPASNLRPM